MVAEERDYTPIEWPKDISGKVLDDLGKRVKRLGMPVGIAGLIMREGVEKAGTLELEVKRALEYCHEGGIDSSEFLLRNLSYFNDSLRVWEAKSYSRVGMEVIWVVKARRNPKAEYPTLPWTPYSHDPEDIHNAYASALEIVDGTDARRLAGWVNREYDKAITAQAERIANGPNLRKRKLQLFDSDGVGFSLLADLESSAAKALDPIRPLVENGKDMSNPALIGVQAGIARYRQLYDALKSREASS